MLCSICTMMAFWEGNLFYWFGVWAQTAPTPAGLSSMALSNSLESLSLPDWESHLLRAALLRGGPHVVYVQRGSLSLSLFPPVPWVTQTFQTQPVGVKRQSSGALFIPGDLSPDEWYKSIGSGGFYKSLDHVFVRCDDSGVGSTDGNLWEPQWGTGGTMFSLDLDSVAGFSLMLQFHVQKR